MNPRTTSSLVIVLLTLAGASVVLAAVVGFGLLPQLTGSAPTQLPTLGPTVPPAASPTISPDASPTDEPSPSPASSPSPQPSPDASPTGGPPASPGGTYTVQPGDSLSSIGELFGVPWTLIAEANDIQDPYIIQVGQQLIIPAPDAEIPTDGDYYIVRPGDTLEGIAYEFGLATYELAEANEIEDWNAIYAGQRLVIPGRGASPSPSPSAEP